MDDLPPDIRRRCLRCLYRTCGRKALLPKKLQIPLCYDPTETPQSSGGFADMWKGEYRGSWVAAKVLRAYKTSDLEVIRKVGGIQLVVLINRLTVSGAAVLRGGRAMEHTSSPELVDVGWRDDDRKSASVRDGIVVEG